jgi:uncharacterized protein (TIGR03435 family)
MSVSNRQMDRQHRNQNPGSAIVLSLTLLLLLLPHLAAQGPAFDVASIKPTIASADSVIQARANGRLDATNTSLRSLILRAYAIHDSQLIGAPGWATTERFDLDARVDTTPPGGPEALMPMLRTLLAERFRLRVHTEMRELPAFVLTVTRRDRRLGSQIRPTQMDCTKPTQLTVDQIRAQARDGWPPCGMVYMVSYVAPAATGLANRMRVRRSGISMQDFATALQASVDRPVVDRTGLEGRFDVEYSFATASDIAAGTAGNQPLLVVALEEQLGLELDAQRTMVPVVVIDSVDRLIEN